MACGVSSFLEGKLILSCVYLFIVSGGETIRNIINMCGAHVELNRAIPESAPTKYFIIRGTPLGEIPFFVLIMWTFCHRICLFVCLFVFFTFLWEDYSGIVGHDQGKKIHLERKIWNLLSSALAHLVTA